jgi:hypothetical protein
VKHNRIVVEADYRMLLDSYFRLSVHFRAQARVGPNWLAEQCLWASISQSELNGAGNKGLGGALENLFCDNQMKTNRLALVSCYRTVKPTGYVIFQFPNSTSFNLVECGKATDDHGRREILWLKCNGEFNRCNKTIGRSDNYYFCAAENSR